MKNDYNEPNSNTVKESKNKKKTKNNKIVEKNMKNRSEKHVRQK